MAQSKTNHFLRAGKLPLVCGHRAGYYAQFPENSLPVIDYTVSKSKIQPAIVEVDIRKSKDGTLYILHDETLDRTTNGQGKIAEQTDAYLSTIHLKLSTGELSSEKILTFEELLKYAKHENVILMLDIKTDVWRETLEAVHKNDLDDKCMVLTFDPAISKKVYDITKTVAISCLIKDESQWSAIQKLGIPAKQLIAYIHETTKETLINELKKQGIPVMTDISENNKGNTSAMDASYYRGLVKNKKLDILITDYPVEASEKLQ
ncbi:glycerophosphodiester phosphodiesterase family protein [Ohtaekwangia sp.]|uniref:glycerophosphodiester phosphodiesterase family protein n=1 Tax=Ohtaekwangia sp. TaxID=2066019 RepID=UPI002F94F040